MEYSSLLELISCLELGTQLHISVVFLGDHGNPMTDLPPERVIHAKAFCDRAKTMERGLDRCYRCRNLALNRAVRTGMPFGGFCINGIYEYCHPVMVEGTAAAVIFIGNLLLGPHRRQPAWIDGFRGDFETGVSPEDCGRIALILDHHIRLLLRVCSQSRTAYEPLLVNILHYLEEYLASDLSVRRIAAFFGYSEQYLGKWFKRRMGVSIRAYIQDRRLERAEQLLTGSDLPVTQIAAMTGFDHVTYFNRLFSAKHGISPTAYRRRSVPLR